MTTSNDLYDIYYSLLLIRDNIRCNENSIILEQISRVICSECIQDNLIRRSISSLDGVDTVKWGFAFHDNVYTFRELIKDDYSLKILKKICLILKELLETKKYEQAYDFVDALHFVPVIIAKKGKLMFNEIKKIEESYTKKWGKIFWN